LAGRGEEGSGENEVNVMRSFSRKKDPSCDRGGRRKGGKEVGWEGRKAVIKEGDKRGVKLREKISLA